MAEIDPLCGDTVASFSIDQTAVIDTVDGADLSTLVTVSLRYTNGDGRIVDGVFTVHIPGEHTDFLFPTTSGQYRVTVESI